MVAWYVCMCPTYALHHNYIHTQTAILAPIGIGLSLFVAQLAGIFWYVMSAQTSPYWMCWM